MKKTLAVLLSAMMLVGCGEANKPAETATPSQPAEAATVKVGAGSYTTVKADSVSADKDGKVSVSTTYAGLVLEGDVVKYLYLDCAKDDSKFNDKGEVEKKEDVKTKKELGPEYHMKDYGNAVAEWNEQAESFEKWAVGKKIDDVLAVKTVKNDEGKTVVDDEDLKTSVTISVDDFLKAIETANKNAKEVEGVAYVGMGSFTELRNSDANADKDGAVEDNTNFTLLALDADKKIVALDLDVAQAGAKFDAKGEVKDVQEVVPTKGEKGEDYGMKKFANAAYEWNEQRDAFAAFANGKTVDEVVNMAVKDGSHGGKVADVEDLKTTCTITVDAFLKSVEKANANLVELGK